MEPEPLPSYLVEPADPFFHEADVLGQFRRHAFFCARCSRREGPALHRDGVLLQIGARFFAVDFPCFAKLELPFAGELLNEGRARRVLPFVRFQTGTVDDEQRATPTTAP
jgi:hypothetical protein